MLPELTSDTVTVQYLPADEGMFGYPGTDHQIYLYDAPRLEGGKEYSGHRFPCVWNFLPVLKLMYPDMNYCESTEFDREAAEYILKGETP